MHYINKMTDRQLFTRDEVLVLLMMNQCILGVVKNSTH